MTVSHTLKTGARAAVLALVLGGTALVALPAQAAGPSFGIQFGTNDDNYRGGDRHHMSGDRDNFRWDQRSIERKLSLSYSHLQYKGQRHGDYYFVGSRGRSFYQLRVDGRTGQVFAKRLYRDNRGGFNFSFNF